MTMLDDTAIFVAVIQHGGFSHAARHLNVSNGLISRRIKNLESVLGVTLIKRTTRQFKLTTEGELFWQHAQRIQQDLEAAVALIRNTAKKPKGVIKMSAPSYIGRQYLTAILMQFLQHYNDIEIDLDLSHQSVDLVNDKMDLVIRGAGFINAESLKISNLKAKILHTDPIKLYASAAYLKKHREPKNIADLANHVIVAFANNIIHSRTEKWQYSFENAQHSVTLSPNFRCNDIEGCLSACISGYGIGKFAGLSVKNALDQQLLFPILQQYDWGQHNLFVLYPSQQNLPQRTRLLIDFIFAHFKNQSGE